MAQFPDMTPTTNGDKMLIQAVNGHKLVFTRGAFGSGSLSDSDDIKTFTALKSEKMSLPIVDTAVSDTGEKITLTFNCSNSSLDTGFINREVGVFAKLDDGDEVLYSYSNAGMAYDYIPSKETPTNENTFEIEVYISSEAEINVTIDGSIVYLTKEQVEEKIDNHDKTTTAHAQAFAAHNDDETAHSKLFGLCEKIADLGDDIIKKLALTTTITAITALTTDSWFGQLLKLVLTASGVKYLAAQNGYLCLGSFFGNIIIQWGSNALNLNGTTQEITLPLNINYAAAAVATMRSGDFPGYVCCPYWSECTRTTICITPDYEVGQGYAGTAQAIVTWILIAF